MFNNRKSGVLGTCTLGRCLYQSPPLEMNCMSIEGPIGIEDTDGD